MAGSPTVTVMVPPAEVPRSPRSERADLAQAESGQQGQQEDRQDVAVGEGADERRRHEFPQECR